ncbi:hypothetical protein GIB67_032515 [Kingdonia uniflora]|uniref:F-box associated domain-containing protein n=1 Tax=Kingdonia uniflora TaxID=39325 RepID=A0A7J7L7L2_9MAGN|nr:hypothetical protein GIB67_032515 [Kingdonia uniflora]
MYLGIGDATECAILSFDSRTEEISELIPLPYVGFHSENVNHGSTLFELEGALSTFRDDHPYVFNIWMFKMYGVEQSWTQIYSIRKSILLHPVYFMTRRYWEEW